MRCPRCRHDNPPQSKFCADCGARVALACVGCGAEVSPGAKFCSQCGRPVAGQAHYVSPEAYTPKHLAERILTSRNSLEGERKQVTVLFADIKGSMELLADRDPEEARKILDPVLEQMMEAVHRYEGTVNQVMGDGIMALFGAPLAHEDHAVRACYAALRMRESAKRYAQVVRRAQGIPIQIRVGLNSGEVVVRSIGSDLHMDYTAVGQTTHIAARMEQMAQPGSILLASDTLALAEWTVEVNPLGPLPVKGLEGPIEVYELTGATTIRSRFQAAAARGLTRFVGRDSELDQLRHALERARAGQGQVVAVVGEPGVGKSRLYWEFSHSHRAQGWLMIESGSVSYGKATNYLPIIELLRAYFQIERADDSRKIGEKVTGKLLSLDRQLERCVAPMLWLLDVPTDDETWTHLDPSRRRQIVLDAVKRLLLRESQVQPLMVLFEDLHWIDAETQLLLDSLVESLPTAQILLLVNYRPEYSHGWGSKTYYRQIRVDPLPPESAEVLLDALLGTDATLAPLKRLVIERTEGNPFFIEESVRTLVESQVLSGGRGAHRLDRLLGSIQVPATVQAVLATRIDRLAPEDKRLLQAAAVIGKDVPLALLQAIAELAGDELRAGLGRLQAAEFLYGTQLFSDPGYTFKHALTHDVAYGSLLNERRRAMHARIVEAIEQLYADRIAEQLERLAHHAFRGEVWEKALSYLRQAGDKASTRSAYREALECFDLALAALPHLAETRETIEQAVNLRLQARGALLLLGELEGLLPYLSEAERLAATLEDQRLLGHASAAMCNYLWQTGASAEARTRGARAQAIGDACGDVELEANANLVLGYVLQTSGDIRGAEDCFHKVIQLLSGNPARKRGRWTGFMVPMARAYLAWLLAERGEFDEGSAQGEEALRLADSLNQPFTIIFACFGVGWLAVLQSDFSRAIGLLERAYALCREWSIGFMTPFAMWSLAYAYALSGRVEEGLALLRQALTAYESKGFRAYSSLILVHLGEVSLLADRLEDARAYAGRALVRTREREERGYEAYALRLLGEVVSRRQPTEREAVESHYDQALARATELGLRPLVAHCHLGLGKLQRRESGEDAARRHLTTAATLYREMEMRLWLEQAEAGIKGE